MNYRLFFFVLYALSTYAEQTVFTTLWFHDGPVTQTLMLFTKKSCDSYQILHEKKSPKRAVLTLKVNNAESSLINSSLRELLKKNKSYSLKSSQSDTSFAFSVNYNPKLYAVQVDQLRSDRFGPGISLRIYDLNVLKKRGVYKTLGAGDNPLRIVIDAGHGGADPGARSVSGHYEKDIVRTIAQKLNEKLQEMGCTVLLNPSEDKTCLLSERTATVNNFQADLCISLHADSSQKPESTGISIRVPHASVLRPMNSHLRNTLAQEYEEARYRESLAYANKLQKELVLHTDMKVKQAYDPFQLLLGVHMPALLIEMGFLSNEHDVQMLLSQSYQQALVQSIANILL